MSDDSVECAQVSGVVLLAAGSYFLVLVNTLGFFLGGFHPISIPVLLIASGAFVINVAVYGSCGAYKEEVQKLQTYAVLLSGVFMLQLGTGIASASHKSALLSNTRQNLTSTMKGFEKYQNVSDNWNTVQTSFKCCGSSSPEDWSVHVGESNVPASCCIRNSTLYPNEHGVNVCKFVKGSHLVRPKGCWGVIEARIKKHSHIAIGISFGFAIMELLGIILSILMAYGLKKDQELKQITILKVWSEGEEGARRPKANAIEIESEEQPRATAYPS